MFAVSSWFTKESSEWLSSFLSNSAVVFLLLVPGEFFLSKIRIRVEHAESAAADAQFVAESAQKTAAATAQTLEDIRAELLVRQDRELESELDIYREMVENPSRRTLKDALQQATEKELITMDGVRSPVWGTNLHYRFVVNDESADLIVRLERDNGQILKSVIWNTEIPPMEFYQELVWAVRQAGSDLGVGLNDPTNSVEELSKMLIQVTELRSQELMGHRGTLRRIIEKYDGWFFTETHIVPEKSLSYTIGIHQLDEIDWEQHLQDKKFDNVPEALHLARELYGYNFL